jgi:hypothetical protein
MKRIIFENETHRIIELEDSNFKESSLNELIDWWFRSEHDEESIEYQFEKNNFINNVYKSGVYGYSLQEKNPRFNKGWKILDTVWSFVGQYNPNVEELDHYPVKEFKQKISKDNI